MGFLDKLRKYDNFWIGIALGIIVPIALFPLLLPINHQNFGFLGASYWRVVLILTPMVLSRCLFPSALLFFLLIWTDFSLTAKGMLYSTVGLTGILILIRIIF